MRFALIATVIGLATNAPVLAEELTRNPFRSPLTAGGGSSAIATTVGGKPRIRGILTAGGTSLVNLNGTIISVGEAAGGYRLLAVSNDTAVFEHDDEIIQVSLYEDEDAGRDND